MKRRIDRYFLRMILLRVFYMYREDARVSSVLDIIASQLRRFSCALATGGIFLLVSTVLTFAAPLLTGFLLDKVIPKKSVYDLLVAISLLFVGLCARCVLQYHYGMIFFRVSSNIILFFREQMFKKICDYHYGYIQKYGTGYILSRLQEDPQRLALLFGDSLIAMIINIVTVIAGLSMMICFNVTLTGITIALLGLLLFIMHYFGIKIRDITENVAEKTAKNIDALQENISIITLASQYKRKVFPVRRYMQSAIYTLRFLLSLESVEQKSGSGVMLVSGVIPLVLMMMCGIYIIQDSMTVGQFVAFLGIVGIIIGPASSLTSFNIELQKVSVGLKRVGDILNLEEGILFTGTVQAIKPHTILFSDISFSYAEKRVLYDVTLQLQKNKTLVIAGPSGSGKSTLAKIITGLYNASYHFYVDGRLYQGDMKYQFLRQKAMLIDQNTMLFSGTIRENMLLGNSNASDEELIEVLIKAQAYNFVRALPDFLDSRVEQRGVSFSAGQCQRLAIARALLAKPDILIVDESTAHIDNLSERLIYDALCDLSEDIMIVVIAHRLEGIKNFDWIYWLKDGKIVEKGTHASLLELGGFYAEQYYLSGVHRITHNMN